MGVNARLMAPEILAGAQGALGEGQSRRSDSRDVEQIQCQIGLDRGRVLAALMTQFDVHRNSGKH